jgi:hypothetical protein
MDNKELSIAIILMARLVVSIVEDDEQTIKLWTTTFPLLKEHNILQLEEMTLRLLYKGSNKPNNVVLASIKRKRSINPVF